MNLLGPPAESADVANWGFGGVVEGLALSPDARRWSAKAVPSA